jgi:hypothetical protein
MSAERPVPSSRQTFHRVSLIIALVVLTYTAFAAAKLFLSAPPNENTWEAVTAHAPGNAKIAFARARICAAGICETLWIGATRESATLVSALAGASEHVDEIAWTPDGKRVGFLINGYQLRMYDAETLTPAGQFSLITPDGTPSSRIARGVTFSENGRAVTFDDCPRARSGCRPALVAVPQ